MALNLALIALGSNQFSSAGAPAPSLRAALISLAKSDGIRLRAVSRFYATPAFPAGSGPDYVNACAALATDLPPRALLDRLHLVESAMGRRRDTGRWGARGIDLDLLAMGDIVLPDPATHDRWRALPLPDQMRETPAELILPHPRLAERAFVLQPLADIAPDWRHPVTGRSVTDMLDDLPPASLQEIRVFLDNRSTTDQVTFSALPDSNRKVIHGPRDRRRLR
ncbi:2-amino-4-hydroxy-6-hydroxymethyldihydropteridine diphosphokinase [Paracoccus jeotgali]|uniref:2-amino-4-hydroxy-6- hydroxymethyldihydropteridine diphosphokinase n=1 Tax=Paracoccus jeotgali TaxID=2065379 RepID=UPI0028AE45F4|nr:2-amino-4-hydroxy-6-hydroxymethyldihydropteridine diphosphokinase [Paracoccus jeotgali]